MNEKNELLFGDNITLKKIQPNFEQKDHSMSYTTVSQCNKECRINDMLMRFG